MSEHPALIPLAKVIGDLRAELLSALEEGRGKELQFRVRPIELQLQIAVTRDIAGSGGVKFWVIELSGKTSYENAMTHTLKLTLEPVGRDGHSEFKISQTGGPEPR